MTIASESKRLVRLYINECSHNIKKKIYIETSIPSFYYENRTDVAAVARRSLPHKWWDNHRNANELVSERSMG